MAERLFSHGSVAPVYQPHLQPQPRRGMRKANLVAVAAVGARQLGSPRPEQLARVLLHEQGGVDVVVIRVGARARGRRRECHVPLDLMPQDGSVGNSQRLERLDTWTLSARLWFRREQESRFRLHERKGALVPHLKEFLPAKPAARSFATGMPRHVANPRVRMNDGGKRHDIFVSDTVVVGSPRLQHARDVHGPQLAHRRAHVQLRIEEDGPLAREENVRTQLWELREQPQRDVARRW
mmetsp:Transcript_11185/g.28027  ORF Transcript_11185/g.28027 Transcript_11185/m.28027 type:complete len:238 (-) Transcript_11185:1541-2254(-)